MLTKENILKVAKEKITDIGGFLVDVKMNTNNNITIYFDKYEGVLIEDVVAKLIYSFESVDIILISTGPVCTIIISIILYKLIHNKNEQ